MAIIEPLILPLSKQDNYLKTKVFLNVFLFLTGPPHPFFHVMNVLVVRASLFHSLRLGNKVYPNLDFSRLIIERVPEKTFRMKDWRETGEAWDLQRPER